MKKQQKLYVWIRESGEVSLIDDPIEIWKDQKFNEQTDRIHQLGDEVEIQVNVSVKNKTVHRGHDFNQKE